MTVTAVAHGHSSVANPQMMSESVRRLERVPMMTRNARRSNLAGACTNNDGAPGNGTENEQDCVEDGHLCGEVDVGRAAMVCL